MEDVLHNGDNSTVFKCKDLKEMDNADGAEKAADKRNGRRNEMEQAP